MKRLLKQFLTICILAVLLVGLQLFAFTEPSQPPPGENVNAPLNTGNIAQIKSGGLVVDSLGIVNSAANALNVTGGAIIGGQLKITGGSPGAGKVLASDAAGLASWQDLAAAAGGIPAGAVMFFNSKNCPSGWTEFTQAQGRYLVGLNPGGTLGGIVGTSLNDLKLPTVTISQTWAHYQLQHWVGSYGTYNVNVPYIQLLVCQKT